MIPRFCVTGNCWSEAACYHSQAGRLRACFLVSPGSRAPSCVPVSSSVSAVPRSDLAPRPVVGEPRMLRVAVLSVHTCPLAALGGWETGGMNVYVRELSRELASRGVQVDVFTRRQNTQTPDVVEFAPGARVIHLDAGPPRAIDKYEVIEYLP